MPVQAQVRFGLGLRLGLGLELELELASGSGSEFVAGVVLDAVLVKDRIEARARVYMD